MVEGTSKSDGKKEILPIFYDVDPADVKLSTNLYKNAIPKHNEKFGSDELKRWEAALVNVARLKGWDLKGKGHGELIDLVVEEVLCKLNAKKVDVPEYLVEDHRQIKAIIEKLDVDFDDVRFLGIHGVGGIGKTILAKVVFNKLSPHFDGISFLNNIRESSQHGLVNLQKRLISSFVGSMVADQIKDIGNGMNWIKRVCNTKKVLIVLDDLDKKKQLEKLAGKSDWFGSGSRIIFTTRNIDILMTRVESSCKEVLNQPGGILAYEVHEMEFGRALQLFCKHAFRRDSPVEGYDHLAKTIVRRVGMLPLAIEVIGSSLYCQSIALGQLFDNRKLWEDTLKQLDEGPFKDVRDALMISYEGLNNKQKEVFLDIACFFTNEDQTYPVIMWHDYDYLPHSAISVLLLRSLIKIKDDNKFWMHDQVRDLGRHIVHEEYAHKFSRVWIHKDAVGLLEKKERNQDVEALSLTSDGCSHSFAPEELTALPNLRFLRLKGSDFFGNFQNLLLKLRWLSWEKLHEGCYVENFHFASLVVLDLSWSGIKNDWGGWSQIKMTKKLKVLDLTGCAKLTRTPDFSNFMSLETLILAWCSELITIDRSIGKLDLLKTLNIKGCSSLGELPGEIGSLHSLTQIVMPQNSKLWKLPERFGDLKSLSSFILDEHPKISQLPQSIGGLVKLTHLSFRGCVGIEELPCSIGELQMLVELDVSKSGMKILPKSIGKLKKLRVIRIDYTEIDMFPDTIGGVEMLEEIHAKGCWNLTYANLEEIGQLSHLRILDLSDTGVRALPEVISCLSHLQKLQLGGSTKLQLMTALPSSLTWLEVQTSNLSFFHDLSNLVNLDYLKLYRLTTALPHSGRSYDLQKLEADWMKEQLILRLPSRLSALKLKGSSACHICPT
ncbi:hypothetical protein ACJRO7_015410 [Eucalyptus globulus]|uniref:TMV resistance protein N-like n=1 Tax=Eucalyptus globulus TaxID=34317 RepID=A0ABD3L4G2_EUCGL